MAAFVKRDMLIGERHDRKYGAGWRFFGVRLVAILTVFVSLPVMLALAGHDRLGTIDYTQ
jgi:hypothetical protein